MSKSLEKVFFSLLSFEINRSVIDDEIKKSITPEHLPSIYKLAKKHDLAHLIADALAKNGLLPEDGEIKQRFLRERDISIYRYRQLQHELERISLTLEKAEIPFMPLKGSILRDYYPESWMRTSCDVDVLVREENLREAISVLASELKYKEGATGSHDVTLVSPSGVHIELHFRLASEDSDFAEHLKNLWRHTLVGWSYRYVMSAEMFYFYHIAHMAIHMRTGGCGVKPFLDLMIIQDKMAIGRVKVDGLLKCSQLHVFEREVVHLANCWFANCAHSEVSTALESYILHGGVYGNLENRVAVQQLKKGGKIRYLFSRVFIGYYEMSIKYPSLKKHKLLFPLYQIYRWFDLLINKRSREYTKATIRETCKADGERFSTTESLFGALEI